MGKLTVKEVQALVREGKPGRYSDDDGLCLKIPPRGVAYWMLRYTLHGKRRELTLGKQAHLSLAEARSEAELQKKAVREGADPIAERKRERRVTIRTLDDLFQDWYPDLERRLKHPQIPKRVYNKEIAPSLGGYCLDAITPMDVRQVIRKVTQSGRPAIANDVLMYLKQLFNHAIKLGLLTYNPAAAFNANDAGGIEKSRDRALSLEEIAKAFQIFREHADSFTRDNRAIGKLFGLEPGKSKPAPSVMGDVPPFTVHDLRRTCRSLLAAERVPPHVAERCLNHKLKGVEGIYDRYDYLDERREALAKVTGRIAVLINTSSGPHVEP